MRWPPRPLGRLRSPHLGLPALWEAAEKLRGFHQWLVTGRLEVARAEILLRLGDHEAAAAEASRAVSSACQRWRRKYEVAARTILAEALADLGRADDGLAEARAAVTTAKGLGHPPPHWLVAATLSRLFSTVGDDEGSSAARTTAEEVVRGFAARLSEPRRTVFLQ